MVYLSCMTTTTSSSEPYRICCLCNEDVPADRVIRTEVGTVCADQYACEVRQGQRLADAPFVCVNCGHEHHYEDTTVRDHDGSILCEDVAACEARGFVVDEPEDPGIDPPFDYSEEEGEPFDCEDLTGQDRDGWY